LAEAKSWDFVNLSTLPTLRGHFCYNYVTKIPPKVVSGVAFKWAIRIPNWEKIKNTN